MTVIYLVRHGETELNKGGVYYGWSDIALTDKGRLQCHNLRNKLKNVKFDAVISSPLKRALESAQIITGLKCEQIVICEELKEMNFGRWESLNYREVSSKYAEDWKNWTQNWQEFCIPEGESFNMVACRVKKSLKEILEKYMDKTVLIVGHEGTLGIISLILLDLQNEAYWKFKFEFGTYSVFEIHNGTAVIRKINC